MTTDRPAPTTIARQAAFRTGVSAESRAAAYLVGRGYAIAARRFKSPVGEVDIVARRGPELLFVEVKARHRLDDAALSVTPRQQPWYRARKLPPSARLCSEPMGEAPRT